MYYFCFSARIVQFTFTPFLCRVVEKYFNTLHNISLHTHAYTIYSKNIFHLVMVVELRRKVPNDVHVNINKNNYYRHYTINLGWCFGTRLPLFLVSSKYASKGLKIYVCLCVCSVPRWCDDTASYTSLLARICDVHILCVLIPWYF